MNFGQADKDPAKLQSSIREYVIDSTLEQVLHVLTGQPLLNDSDSWRLRSLSAQKERIFSEILVANYERLVEFWNLIVDQARTLIHPEDDSCVVCQLLEVNRKGSLTLLAGTNYNPDGERFGICRYVARTSQLFLIDDIPAYDRETSAQGTNFATRPKYLKCGEISAKSEISCPLVVQGKVVGVLNLESKHGQPYGEREALLLYLYATSVSLSLRQFMILRDLRITTELQNELLSLDDEDAILRRTLEAVNDLKYIAGIWYFDEALPNQGRWVQGSASIDGCVRLDSGHTLWIRDHRLPVAVADYDTRQDTTNSPHNQKMIGELDDIRLFRKWRDPRKTPKESDEDFLKIQPNPKIGDMARNISKESDFVSDFGFPIFANQGDDEVRAVLWAKCLRHFISVLDEEIWFLSLVCRTASIACRVRRDRLRERQSAKFEQADYLRLELLKFHFGERGQILFDLGRQGYDDLLAVKQRDKLVVLEIDLRGSTEFARNCFAKTQGQFFTEIIRQYHAEARRLILSHGGAFDKSIGDAVIGHFSVFRDDILPFGETTSLEQSMRNAVRCAFEIFKRFRAIVDQYRVAPGRDPSSVLRFDPAVSLGAAVTVGIGFIGSMMTADNLAGLDFTVYGDVSNEAGKNVDLARVDRLLGWRTDGKIKTRYEQGNSVKAEAHEFDDLRLTGNRRVDVLLCDSDFLPKVGETLSEYRCYAIELEKGNLLWIREAVEPLRA